MPTNAVTTQPAAGPLRVLVFYTTNCPSCRKLEKAMADCQKRWGARIRLEKHNLAEQGPHKFYGLLVPYEKHYGSEEDKAVKAFLGERSAPAA